MEIVKYNSDSGDRDLSSEEIYDRNLSFIEILQIAYKLKAHLIVKTSYINETRPGHWYIKGYKNIYSYEEIRLKIEENVRNRKHTKRICFLIKYLEI